MTISIEPVLQFGDFTSPLRNIRARLDEYSLVLDLVPSRTLPDSVKVDPGLSDALKLIIGGGHEIVEADSFLRLEFEQIWGWMTHEELSENVAIPLLMQNLSKREAYAKAASALAKIGLAENLYPNVGQSAGP